MVCNVPKYTYIPRDSVYRNSQQLRLEIGKTKAFFLEQVVLDSCWKSCRSTRTSNMVTSSKTYINLEMLVCWFGCKSINLSCPLHFLALLSLCGFLQFEKYFAYRINRFCEARDKCKMNKSSQSIQCTCNEFNAFTEAKEGRGSSLGKS